MILKKFIPSIKVVVLCSILFSMTFCNTAMERSTEESYPGSESSYQSGHVLMIVLDGASGKAVQAANNVRRTPNIKSMLINSMYTFDGLQDATKEFGAATADRGWVNMFTGTTKTTVGVGGSTIADNIIPSFMSRIKEARPLAKISFNACNNRFYDAFSTDATASKLYADDQQVCLGVEQELANVVAAPSDLIVAQLSGAEIAGTASGYFDEHKEPTQAVIDAVAQIDQYIGNMMTALRARPNYEAENWLVVIASSFGGSLEGNYGADAYNNVNMNTFNMLYSIKLSNKLLIKPSALPYEYYSPVYSGQSGGKWLGTKSASVIDPTLFDIEISAKSNSTYTVQFMHNDPFPNAGIGSGTPWGDHMVISKRKKNQHSVNMSTPGWHCRYWGDNELSFYPNCFNGAFQTGKFPGNTETSRNWSVITMVIGNSYPLGAKKLKDKDTCTVYVNGVQVKKQVLNHNTNDITIAPPRPMANPESPLTIGWIEGSDQGNRHSFFITNLQFYNCGLPEEYIKKNYMKTHLEEIQGFEYWDNLLGYWPCDREEDFGLDVLKDYSKYGSVFGGVNAGKSDMKFNGPVAWRKQSDFSKEVEPTAGSSYYRSVFNTVDIPLHVIQWVGIAIDNNWEMTGVSRALNYKY